MNKTYNIKVNNTIDFEVNEKDLIDLDTVEISDKKFHILHDNKSHIAEVTEANFDNKHYQITVNNNIYNISISNELDVLINKMGLSSGTTKLINSIKAPMPGLILEMNIKIGQEVKENDTLFILEAMKMENSITSPRAGIIKSILASNGEAVDKNQLLIEFE